MDTADDVDTIAGRLATFHRPHHFNKRRASAASKKAQTTVAWPHESPTPDQLARAGFYFKPSSVSNDSVTCFLCGKALDGWDPQDDPALEHLSHVPDCGWAINVCIERRAQDMDRAEEDPLAQHLIQARRSTFKDAWPHESKKGWKCKVQKMVEAGWCYSPLPEADDCVHCFYCGVSLDGWEPKDDPWEEHRRRAPECHFFTLVDEAAKTAKQKQKPARGRQSRASKSSRISTQSNATISSELPSLELDESEAEDDDTVLTAASVVSKPGKGRKKAAKSKAAPRKPRNARATKQASAVDESIMSDVEASTVAPAKARSTRARKGSTVGESFSQDVEISEVAPKKTRATRTKKASTEDDTASAEVDAETSIQLDTTLASPAGQLEQPKARAKKQTAAATTTDEPSKAPARKASRAKAPKSKPLPRQDSVEEPDNGEQSAPPEVIKPTRGKKRSSDGLEKIDSSVMSIDAAPAKKPQAKAAAPKRGRAASRAVKQTIEEEPEREPAAVETTEAEDVASVELPTKKKKQVAKMTRVPSSNATEKEQDLNQTQTADSGAAAPPPTLPLEPSHLSPTVSPQSSDAENHPPSSRPSLVVPPTGEESPSSKRVPLKPTTPQASPSKRIIAGGLTSVAPWTPVDLEHIFLPSPSSRRIQGLGSNESASVEEVMGRLTSPEKQMSVEQWIMWNAQKAEERLKGECERLIGAFEGEGVKALRALEGIECT